MDEGRYHQLRELQKVLDDPTRTRFAKKSAYRTQQDILRQLKDKKLTHLREQLLNAANAGDKHAEWKISCQIRDYLKKEKVEQYS